MPTPWADDQNRRGIAVWLHKAAGQTFSSYDDPTAVQLKAIYVKRGGLAGALVWAIKHDDVNGSLIKTLANGLTQRGSGRVIALDAALL